VDPDEPYNGKMTPPLLNFAEVRRMTGLSRVRLLRLMKCGLFPSPAQLSCEHTRWREIDVRDWMTAATTHHRVEVIDEA
jgi:predicted DNA-binding transcriptional regulator AlpA